MRVGKTETAACARGLYDIVLPRREMCSDTTVVISYLVLRTPENLMINPYANKLLHSLFQTVDHFLHVSPWFAQDLLVLDKELASCRRESNAPA